MTSLTLPPSWQAVLAPALAAPSFQALDAFLTHERATKTIFPPADQVFTALALTPFHDVRVVILGQDPYHDDGQAHGLCFSVKPPTRPPPSLKNIFKELEADLGIAPAAHGDLTAWARQGVLLLNAVLTVEAHNANAHKDKGWEAFTDAVIAAVNAKATPVVFVLWGAYAQKKAKIVDATRHTVIAGAHPSPLSVKKFLGSRPFSAVNAALVRAGHNPIDWRLPPA